MPVVLLALIYFGINRERKRLQSFLKGLGEQVEGLGEQVETLTQQVKATQDMAESPPETASTTAETAGLSNWDIIRADRRLVRDRIELAIKRIRHKSRREKYSKFDRYSYQKIIQSLLEDQEIHQRTAASLLAMNSKFLSLRTRTASTSRDDVAAFKGWLADVDKELPQIAVNGTSAGAS